jgi:predicted  nucleic acid-binding Zn-ribbon protein
MYSGMISSDREHEAIRNELGALRGRKNALEDDLIATMERVEELFSLVGTLEERHTELTIAVTELTAARDEAAKDIDGELAEQRTARSSVTRALDDALLARYDQIRARGNGLGVAELNRRTCLGCNLDLTIIEYEEVRDQAQRGLPSCPQCNRLLVIPTREPEPAPEG